MIRKLGKWEQIERQIRQFIAEKDFENAIQLLEKSAIEKQNTELQEDIAEFKKQFAAFQKQLTLGLLTKKDIKLQENNFVYSLEYFIHCLKSGGAVAIESASESALEDIKVIGLEAEEGPSMAGTEPDIAASAAIALPKMAEAKPRPQPMKSSAKPQKNSAKPKTEGGILYNIPNKMQLGVQNKCIVRLAFDKNQLKRVTDNFSNEVIKTVQVSDIMEVELLDISGENAFNIQFVSQKEQFIDKNSATEWLIMVKALKAGSFSLALKVAIIEKIDGKDRRKETILEEIVAVVGEAVVVSNDFKSVNQPFQPVGVVQTLLPNMPEQKTVLFMGANPPGTTFLQLEVEHSRISTELEGKFRFPTAKFLSAVEMPKLFIVHKPNIVHFSGHGQDPSVKSEEKSGGRGIQRIKKDAAPSGGIVVFDNDMRGMKVLEDKVLDLIFANTVQKLKIPIEVVVFNSCFSESQAKVVGKSVPYVVGTSRAIKDEIAIGFAVGFYFGLANGLSVEDAFTTGKTEAVIASDIDADNLIVLYKNGVKIDNL